MSISVDLDDDDDNVPKKRNADFSVADRSFYPRMMDRSYFFIEISGEAIEEKLDEYSIGYTYNIHNWASNPHKRKSTSRYLLILKTDSAHGGRAIWERVRDLAKREGLECKRSFAFDSICASKKQLLEFVKNAVADVSFKITTYKIPELMY